MSGVTRVARALQRYSALALCTMALLAGCASFRGNELEALDRDAVLGRDRLPPVTYDVLIGEMPDDWPGWLGGSVHRIFRDAFESAHCEARAEEPHGEVPHVEVFVASRARHEAFSMGLSFVTLLTLGIVPSYGRDDLVVSAQVFRGENVTWRRDYHDHRTWWAHLFMIPWAMSHDVRDVHRDVLENMLLHLVRDLEQEAVLAPSGAVATSG